QSISDRTILEDSVLGPISFTVGYQETPAGSLTLTGTSSNPSIVPVDNISYGGRGASPHNTPTPPPHPHGIVTIGTTPHPACRGTASRSFVLTIPPANAPPTISDIPNQTTPEDVVLGPIQFTVGDPDSDPATLTVSGASSNPTLIPNANISFAVVGGGGALR